MSILKALSVAALLVVSAGGASAIEAKRLYVECGGSFANFVSRMKAKAEEMTYPPQITGPFFREANFLQRTINADRRQGIFRSDFIEFSRKLIAQYRLDRGRQNSQRHDAIFTRIEREMGVPRGILLSFWAFETDFGAFTGDFNTLDTLMTLSHDCRRPELFQPQVFAMLELYARGEMGTNEQGAWAGEVGQVQMLPLDIMERGIDGDGDGHVDLDNSVADALFSGANMLRSFGWRAGEPWMQEIIVPQNLPWEETGVQGYRPVSDWQAWGVTPRSGAWEGPGLEGAVMLPMGRNGPAFLIYPNYRALFEWNQSFVYVATAAYFATRLQGAPVYNPGTPSAMLSDGEMKALQTKLQERGHDVGKIDGILGSGTRNAVRLEQQRLGLPADAWPTRELLNRL